MTEKKRTAINLAAKIVSYSTTLLISFFLTPYLVNNIGKEEYSFYPLANNFVNYMGIVTVALNSMASRFITISLTKGDRKKANIYFISILISNVILSIVLFVPMTLIVAFLQYILDIPADLVFSVKLLFSLVFISMIVNLLTNVFGVACFSQNRLELSSIQEIIVGILRIVLYALLFTLFRPTVVFVGVVSLATAIVTVAIQIKYTKMLLPFIEYKKEYFDISAIKEIVGSGIWNSVNQIGVTLLSTVGLMMCNKLYGVSEGGDYSIALTIPTFINGIVNMLSSVFLPGLTIKYAQGNKERIIHHVHTAQELIGLIVNIPIGVFMAVGVNFFMLWTPGVDPYKLQKLSILAIGYLIITSVAWPVSNLNTVMNKVKVPALVMVGTGITNIVLIFLTYKFTNIGVYSIPLGQMVLFILNRAIFVGAYSAHCLQVKWHTFYPALVKSVIGTGIVFAISSVVNRMVYPTTWVGLIAECVLLGCVGLVVNGLVILKPSGIKNVINEALRRGE